MVVFWFRRDLRADDNVGFYEALKSGEKVLPIFIFDREILEELPKDDARVTFISQLLDEVQATFKKHHKKLAVFYGKPKEVFSKLLKAHEITAVYTNHDYEPYARQRDAEIEAMLKGQHVAFHTYKDQVIFEKSEVVKDDGKPYVVYTPYSKKWMAEYAGLGTKNFASEDHLDQLAAHDYPYLSLSDIGFKPSEIKVPEYDISKDVIHDYEAKRNFPALDETSHLSPHLRFGSISIRKCIAKAAADSNITFLKELIWREFFMQILWHFPHTVNKSFREKYDDIKWSGNEKHFKSWCEGKTGYPMVDAGMRQLNATGRMHNRVRLVVSSFLCKHLLIDWRWGEAYFAEKLLDYEQSSNVGNWQWAAGCGTDAAPYFRIFNPQEQAKKFDGKLQYIRKWVPELESLSYPDPIVDHKEAREKALRTYKEAVG